MRFRKVLLRVVRLRHSPPPGTDGEAPASMAVFETTEELPVFGELHIYCERNSDVVFTCDGKELDDDAANEMLWAKKPSEKDPFYTEPFWIVASGEVVVESMGLAPFEIGCTLTPSKIEFLSPASCLRVDALLAESQSKRL